ncbi:MAG: hypothetical protein ACHBN1_32980 [Heteroscytonema crispum UTEX LB 1556]
MTNNYQPNGRTSTRSVTKSAVRASPPTTNYQLPFGFTSRLGRETLPRAPLHQLPTTN